MSSCTNCGGTGTISCPTCHGQGYTTRLTEDGEESRRLCGACEGKRRVRCSACHGTGELVVRAPVQPLPTQPRPQAHVDRLAGRWNGVQGTWYEFVLDGNRYRATAGGPAGVSGTGTATLVGHKVSLDATDALLGHYLLELALHGDHLEGIDRKAGFPLPVMFKRA